MFNVFAMDSYDREIAVAEKAFEIEMSEVAYLEAMVDAKLKINLARSEYKVMTESTAETAAGDLCYLYNEAAKEAEENATGFLTKAKNAVITFFTTVWNSIQKVFTKVDTEAYKALKASKEKVNLPCNASYIADKGEKIAAALEGNGNIVKKAIAVAAALGVTIGGGVTIKNAIDRAKEEGSKPTTILKSDAIQLLERIKDLPGRLLNAIKGVNENDAPEGDNAANGFFSHIQAFGGMISNAFKSIMKAVGLKGDVEDTDESKGGKESTPAEPAKTSSGSSAMDKAKARIDQAKELKGLKQSAGVKESSDDDLDEDLDPVME